MAGKPEQTDVLAAIKPAGDVVTEPEMLDDLSVSRKSLEERLRELKAELSGTVVDAAATDYGDATPTELSSFMRDFLELARQSTDVANAIGRVSLGLLSAEEAKEANRLAQERKALADTLTPREKEVLGLMADNHWSSAVGSILGISEQTVKMHSTELYRKLGVPGRIGAIKVARELGLGSEASEDDRSDITVTQTDFSPRQLDVLELLTQGLNNKVIGEQLGITDDTVKFHLLGIYRTMNINRQPANRRAMAMQIARKNGIFPEPEPDIAGDLEQTFVEADELFDRAIEQTQKLRERLQSGDK